MTWTCRLGDCCSLQMKMTMDAGQHWPEGRMRHHYGAECHWVTLHICSVRLGQTAGLGFRTQAGRSIMAFQPNYGNCVRYILDSSYLNVKMLLQILKCTLCRNDGLWLWVLFGLNILLCSVCLVATSVDFSPPPQKRAVLYLFIYLGSSLIPCVPRELA